LISVFFSTLLHAQRAIPVDSVINLLKGVRTAYDSSHNLSFNVSYIQTPENAPDNIMDSLTGYVQIDSGKFHWSIGNTEVVTNSGQTIMLFKDDKVMYITNTLDPDSDLNPDPLERLNKFLLTLGGIQCTTNSQDDTTSITIQFPEGVGYKSVTITIDNNTQLIRKTVFILKGSNLQGSTPDWNQKEVNQNENYHIEANYSNYNSEAVSDSVFDKTNYFIKTTTGFAPTAAYSDYKIFIGSPNL